MNNWEYISKCFMNWEFMNWEYISKRIDDTSHEFMKNWEYISKRIDNSWKIENTYQNVSRLILHDVCANITNCFSQKMVRVAQRSNSIVLKVISGEKSELIIFTD